LLSKVEGIVNGDLRDLSMFEDNKFDTTKVDFANRNSLVVKFVKEDRHPHNIIEKQSKFSEYLRGQGILTPRRYISGDSHCIKYKLKDMCLDVTVEDYLGEEIKTMDFKLAYKSVN
jgi:hypothetical protein